MKYQNMNYVRPEDFPSVTFAPAAAIREPLRAAINSARLQPDEKMETVKELLQLALDMIEAGAGQAPQEPADESTEEAEPVLSDDPLDLLLGPAEAEPDAG
jgi:hypothetical protein